MSQSLALTHARLVTPFRVAEDHTVVIQDGRIARVGAAKDIAVPAGVPTEDMSGLTVAPGFVDVHVHGGAGRDFVDPEPDALEEACRFHARHGTTSLLATLAITEADEFLRRIERLAQACGRGAGQGVLRGIHLEGPFVNPDISGALNPDCVWPASVENWARLNRVAGGALRLMTIAPELPGALEVMRLAASSGVVLAIAHSRAPYEQIEEAIDNGLTQVTHIFNAMDPMHHRRPGVVVAALLRQELKVHLIADGLHVHPAVMRLLLNVKGPSGILLITDAVRASGMPDGEYEFTGRPVRVSKGLVTLHDGTMAGSAVTMERAVRVMLEQVGAPITDAVRMASLNAARVLGIDSTKGSITVGKDADLVVLDGECNVRMTLLGGDVLYRGDGV